ncbi:MAG TPA: DUF58 domain-containing protein [Gemmatimonadaceae bacterium]|jgi:uncharacterized protein (DUF58 family)|nr:DUF58 domain-containing protein [Gemmatimonadaceae bacterium]
MDATRADLFDPASLAALGRIEIVARWIVDGFMSGLHRSPRKGFSVEFAEYRAYQSGDDPRYVDWKIAARSDRWVVRQYEEETNLRSTIVLDVSKSMDWSGARISQFRAAVDSNGGERLTKLAYAERLTAALALLLLRQRDAVGLVRFDDRVRSAIPPRARNGQWRRVVAALEDPGIGRASSAPEALHQAARLINRRGMIVLISDLLMEIGDVERAMRGLRAAGHDVTVLHVMDPAERELPSGGEALFFDPESGLAVPASVADVRIAYKNTVDEVIAEWRGMFGSLGIGYEIVSTDAPFGVPLRRAFAARQALP